MNISREFKILIVLLIIIGIVFGALAYLNFRPTKDDIDFEKMIIDDREFEEIIAQLDTSEKLIDYLNKNFKIEEREKDSPLIPKDFFEAKKGTTWDFAVFTTYILWKNDYDGAIIRYKYDKDKISAVVVFRDKDVPKTIIFTKQGISMYPHGWSFEEMFQKEKKRMNMNITDYATSYWTDKGELWPEEWGARKP
jgi:hypothetical protein